MKKIYIVKQNKILSYDNADFFYTLYKNKVDIMCSANGKINKVCTLIKSIANHTQEYIDVVTEDFFCKLAYACNIFGSKSEDISVMTIKEEKDKIDIIIGTPIVSIDIKE